MKEPVEAVFVIEKLMKALTSLKQYADGEWKPTDNDLWDHGVDPANDALDYAELYLKSKKAGEE